jgi:AcrR family transcriptional regulator
MPYPSKTDREAILAAAIKLVEEAGAESLAIRSVAASLGLAPNALYRYFDSLAALQSALASESRQRLLKVMQKAAERKRPPEAIRAISEAYVRFAKEHPHLFSLTMRPLASEEEELSFLESWQFVLKHVSLLYGEKLAPEAAVTLWSFLYGIIVLDKAGAFGDMKPSSSFAFGLRMWINAASPQR